MKLDLSLPEKGNSLDKGATFEILMAITSEREARIVELQRVERDCLEATMEASRILREVPPTRALRRTEAVG